MSVFPPGVLSFVARTGCCKHNLLLVVVAAYKPYKSAYVKDPAPGTVPAAAAAAASRWYCEVCAKSFNGPQPYNAHMLSRAHKDELAAQA